jgi:hypothetical protein
MRMNTVDNDMSSTPVSVAGSGNSYGLSFNSNLPASLSIGFNYLDELIPNHSHSGISVQHISSTTRFLLTLIPAGRDCATPISRRAITNRRRQHRRLYDTTHDPHITQAA